MEECRDAPTSDASDVFIPSILERISAFLPPNEVAGALRHVSGSTFDQFSDRNVVRLEASARLEGSPPAPSSPPPTASCRAISYKRRLQLLCRAAASGNMNVLKLALAAAGLCPTVHLTRAAAAAGQLHVCRWLAERGCPLEGSEPARSPLAAAARGGHAEVCEWLLEQGCTWHEECVLSALRGGHVGLMRSLLGRAPAGPSIDAEALLAAAAEGCDLPTLQKLSGDWGYTAVTAFHAFLRTRDVQRCPHEHGHTPGAFLLAPGAQSSTDDGVEALVEASEMFFDWASLQALWREWLAQKDSARPPPLCDAALAAAARSPTPDWAAKMAWLLEQGTEPAVSAACAAAAACPADDVVRRLTLLVERGIRAGGRAVRFPCDSSALGAAVRDGRDEAVTWLLRRGVRPEDNLDMLAALAAGHRDVLQALQGAGYLLTPTHDMIEAACLSGDIYTAGWTLLTADRASADLFGPAYGRALPQGTALLEPALKSGSLELVTWLSERGGVLEPGCCLTFTMRLLAKLFLLNLEPEEVPPSSALWSCAVDGGCVDLLDWLAEKGFEGPQDDTEGLYETAAARGDLLTLRALCELGVPLGYPQPQRRKLAEDAIRALVPPAALRCLLRCGFRTGLRGVDGAAAGGGAGGGVPGRLRRAALVGLWAVAAVCLARQPWAQGRKGR